MGSKSNEWCPYQREGGEKHAEKGRRPCADGGRDWSEQLQDEECRLSLEAGRKE